MKHLCAVDAQCMAPIKRWARKSNRKCWKSSKGTRISLYCIFGRSHRFCLGNGSSIAIQCMWFGRFPIMTMNTAVSSHRHRHDIDAHWNTQNVRDWKRGRLSLNIQRTHSSTLYSTSLVMMKSTDWYSAYRAKKKESTFRHRLYVMIECILMIQSDFNVTDNVWRCSLTLKSVLNRNLYFWPYSV